MDIINNADSVSFKNILNLWKNIYKYTIVTYLEIKTGLEAKLLYGRVIFAINQPNIENIKFETQHISAVRYIETADESTMDLYFLKATDGEVASSNGGKKAALGIDSRISTYFVPPLSSLEIKFPVIRFSGISKNNLMSKTVSLHQLDSELKSAQQPFDTLDELLIFYGLPSLNQMGDATAIEIIAINPALVRNDSNINSGMAIIKCSAAKDIVKEKLRLGFRIFKDKQIDRGSKMGTDLVWENDKEAIIGTLKIPVENSTLLQAYLSYSDICIDKWWMTDPSKLLNPRQVIHETLEKDLESLKGSLLNRDTGKAKPFESAVTTLLHLLGFSVVNYGLIPKLSDGPDIIAITPHGHIVVIECTVGLPDKDDKMAKLVQRSSLIKSKMKETGYDYLEIQSVIITSLSREEIKVDFETAAKYSIAVVSRENIEELLKRVRLPLDAEKLFKEAKKLVPPIDSKAPAPISIAPLMKP